MNTLQDNPANPASSISHALPRPDLAGGSQPLCGAPLIRPIAGIEAESHGDSRGDVRLVEVFLRATRTLDAAAVAREIGVRPTTMHCWRATGGEPLTPEIRAGILAYLVRWSMRAEFPGDPA